MKFLATLLVQNNEQWLPMFKTMFEKIKAKYDVDLWVYENNSKDNSKQLLYGDHIVSENLEELPKGSRTERIAFFRNRLKSQIPDGEYDYMLCIDSGLFFSLQTFETLLETLETNKDIVMVVPHTMVKTSIPCEFFYDTYATITMEGEKCGQFTSVIECNSKSPYHDRHCHRVTKMKPIFSGDQRLCEVKASCGGFYMVRYEAYKNAWYKPKTPTDCDPWSFCEDVSAHGKIVIDRDAKSLWSEIL